MAPSIKQVDLEHMAVGAADLADSLMFDGVGACRPYTCCEDDCDDACRCDGR